MSRLCFTGAAHRRLGSAEIGLRPETVVRLWCEDGMVTDRFPVAFRAEARIEPSRWLRRPTRVLHYDAYWADGRIERDVNLVEHMYRRAPADFAVMQTAIDEHCPPLGTGDWVQYPYGNVLVDPARRPY